MIPTVGSHLNLTVDTRWTHGVFAFLDEPERFELPFVGWATVVGWVRGDDEAAEPEVATYECHLRPVFMTESGNLTTAADIYEDREAHLQHLVRKD